MTTTQQMTMTVLSSDAVLENQLIHEMKREMSQATSGDFMGVTFTCAHATQEMGELIFVDSRILGLDLVLKKIDRQGRAVFLIVPEKVDEIHAARIAGSESLVDDCIVAPFRGLEILSKLKQSQQIVMWNEVSKLNASFSVLLKNLGEDLGLAERMQKSKLPVRFADIKSLKIHQRYLAGMRSGGDHFDLADSRDGSQLSLVLSDSSSYGLSSAVLSALMRITVKLSVEETRSCRETVRRIYDEILLTLNDKDKLSLFYGVLSRKDFKLRYLNLGSSSAFVAPLGGKFREIPLQGGAITKAAGLAGFDDIQESELKLNPDDRLALISDGYVEVIGGAGKVCELLDRFRKAEPVESLNEMVFQVKSGFKEPDDMPAQDCTAVIFDVDPKLLRLA